MLRLTLVILLVVGTAQAGSPCRTKAMNGAYDVTFDFSAGNSISTCLLEITKGQVQGECNSTTSNPPTGTPTSINGELTINKSCVLGGSFSFNPDVSGLGTIEVLRGHFKNQTKESRELSGVGLAGNRIHGSFRGMITP